jgi:5-formyltetrahydrofolate cyclo-ligase
VSENGSVADAKRALRVRMRSIRAEVAADAGDRARRSREICRGLVAVIEPRLNASGHTSRILLYDALPGEPDLSSLAAWCAENNVPTYLPIVEGVALRIEPGDLAPSTLDIVIVPGLAFTLDGTRLGQGGGHFDRFLARLGDHCLRVGVAFREQLLAELPTAAHDIAVDLVITD